MSKQTHAATAVRNPAEHHSEDSEIVAAIGHGDGDGDGESNPGAETREEPTVPDVRPRPRRNARRILKFGSLAAVILAAAATFGYLTWLSRVASQSEAARAEAVRVASADTIAILSYRPESVEKDLNAARDLLTGKFRDEYTKLINDVVIPGAKQNRVSAIVTVPAAAAITATPTHAVVILFVNQTTLFGDTPPNSTSSSVRVTLDKVGDRWLMSQFDPV